MQKWGGGAPQPLRGDVTRCRVTPIEATEDARGRQWLLHRARGSTSCFPSEAARFEFLTPSRCSVSRGAAGTGGLRRAAAFLSTEPASTVSRSADFQVKRRSKPTVLAPEASMLSGSDVCSRWSWPSWRSLPPPHCPSMPFLLPRFSFVHIYLCQAPRQVLRINGLMNPGLCLTRELGGAQGQTGS